MDQQEIIKIIEANPKLSFEEMRKEAQDIGLDMKLFDSAWSAASKKRITKKRVLIILAFTLIILALVATKLMKPCANLKVLDCDSKIYCKSRYGYESTTIGNTAIFVEPTYGFRGCNMRFDSHRAYLWFYGM